ncbi:DUF3093 domain-containing protein [Actinotalea sp. BY-33]|uniref:DUF3093 domain-containing protein n=1 Tax=Actinotalea soli TaxID=2819234 RepID=A0A939LSJ2_9CELL|nr:DUF3093 domain-containing protein [Actinotalea soli]MBO1750557.1 DUF3093 domain-containing protein [Actinotalea soli]
MTASPSPSPPSHAERLWPGPLGWAAVVGFAVLVLIALLPVQPLLAVVVGALALVVLTVAAVRTSPRVVLQHGELRAGPARIPVTDLGVARVLDKAQVRDAMGPGSDARTYVCLRAWIPTAVHVEVVDPRDPTPGWLVSSRRPDELVAAITRAQGRDKDQAAHSEQIG